MKNIKYVRFILSALFIAFFVSSCYTQLAVVKTKRVYVHERPVEREQQVDTVYYEEDGESDTEVYVYHDYYDYPPPITWRSRYYDPFWNDYYWDDYYYSSWHRPYYNPYGYDYYWHRPIYIDYHPYYWDNYYGSDWNWNRQNRSFKPRHFAKNGSSLRTGSRHVASGSRGSRNSTVDNSIRSASTRRAVRTPSARNTDDIQVTSARSGRTTRDKVVEKSSAKRTKTKVVRTSNDRTSKRKYYRVTKSQRDRTSKSGSRSTTVRKSKDSGKRSDKAVKSSKSSSKSRSKSYDSKKSSSSSRSSSSSGSRVSSSRSSSSSSGKSRSSSSSSSSRSSRSSGSSKRK